MRMPMRVSLAGQQTTFFSFEELSSPRKENYLIWILEIIVSILITVEQSSDCTRTALVFADCLPHCSSLLKRSFNFSFEWS